MVKYICISLCCLASLAKGQELNFEKVNKLSIRLNKQAEEIMPLLSPDGRTLYFALAGSNENVGGKFSGTDIWKSEWDVTIMDWGTPTNIRDLFNDKGNNTVVGVSETGDVLYILNARATKKTKGIYFSKKIGSKWTKPELVPVPGIQSEGFLGAYVSPDFEVMLFSMELANGNGKEDLYISFKGNDGNWSVPKNLGPTINTSGFEISPFLSSDKKRLYFSSNGHQGFGDADIFYCDRLFDSWETWSVPKNVGEGINSKSFDAFLSVYSDSVFLFSSNRSGKASDVYKAVELKQTKVSKVEVVRQYLSTQETIDLTGVEPKLIFGLTSNSLTENHKQTLRKINNAIINRKEIRCSLVALKNSSSLDLEIYQGRLLAILEYLKSLGLEGSRVSLGLEQETVSDGVSGSVIIRLYK